MRQVWVGELGEFGLVVASDDVVVVDVEPFEDSFVEFSPTRVGGLPILILRVAQDEQASVEDGDQAVATHGGLCEDMFGGSSIDSETVLFSLEVFDADRVGVVCFEEFLGLIGDKAQLAGGFGAGRVVFGEHGIDVFDDVGSDLDELFVGATDSGPVGDDCFFDVVGLHGSEGAAVLPVLTAEAVEVVVDLAYAISGSFEGQRFPAVAAVQHTF